MYASNSLEQCNILLFFVCMFIPYNKAKSPPLQACAYHRCRSIMQPRVYVTFNINVTECYTPLVFVGAVKPFNRSML